ncbi:MAG: N-acetyltransferase [Verrucomicrobia bacterium]|nr:N-acetyltransferase [Verrucomicrobiota bacterium]
MKTESFEARDCLLAELADGTPVLFRPVMPEDRKRLVAGMTQLSADSRYFRFFTPLPRLAEEQLRYFTEVDQHNHVAWIAVNPILPEQPGQGIGRFVRRNDQPTVAEFALTVIDAAQSKGLGTAILAILYLLAWEGGVCCLHGIVLPENRVVTTWLARLGAKTWFAAGVYEVELPVSRDISCLPNNPSAERFRSWVERMSGLRGEQVVHSR